MKQQSSPACIRFGVFELNLHSGELRKYGSKIKLSKQAIKLLGLLLQRPGVVHTRSELQRQLWPAGVFVDFEHSLNKLIHELRTALGDPASSPRYIETMAGQGYRFIPEPEPKEHAVRSRAGRRIDSLAVLPFSNQCGDPELDFITKRITERIIDTTSRSAGMRVVAFSTVQRYRGQEFDPRAVGEELRVRAVVAGEMVCRNNDLFLHLELIDVSDGTQRWGAQFQEACCDVLACSEKLAQEICAQLQPVLGGRQRAPQDQPHLHLLTPSDPWVA